VSWYAKGSGITVQYGAFLLILISLYAHSAYFSTEEQIQLCINKTNCFYARNFSAQIINWLASKPLATVQLQYESDHTGAIAYDE
jgi:hypothetical protein